jgi:hypothetical protein
MFNNYFSLLNLAAYEMWKKTVQPGRPQIKIWRMRSAYLITRGTDTQSEYVILLLLHANMVTRNRLHVKLKSNACLVKKVNSRKI